MYIFNTCIHLNICIHSIFYVESVTKYLYLKTKTTRIFRIRNGSGHFYLKKGKRKENTRVIFSPE